MFFRSGLLMLGTLCFTTFIAAGFVKAETSEWSDVEICRAATKTYFFLKKLPTDATSPTPYVGFRSASGNLYTCLVDGSIIEFSWINKSGEKMKSRSTRYTLDGNQLTVVTDLKTESFLLK